MTQSEINIFKENARELTILIAEDDLALLKNYETIFKKYFKNIYLCKDGYEALITWEKNRDKIDLILTDISMPKLNGIELAKNIREKESEIPIIVISAYSEIEFFIDLINIGIDGFVLKPISMPQLNLQLYKITKLIVEKKAIMVYEKGLESYFDTIVKNYKKLNDIKNIISVFVDIFSENEIKRLNDELVARDINNEYLLIELKKKELKSHQKSKQFEEDNKKEFFNNIEIEKDKSDLTSLTRKRINAKKYLESIEFDKYCKDIMDDICALSELTSEIYELLENNDINSLNEVGNLFERYSAVMRMFVEFKELANNIEEIAIFLKELKEEMIDDKNKLNLFKSLIGALLIDIDRWKDAIFVTKDSVDIHFWDHQIESITKQIVNFFSTSEVDEEKDDGTIMFF